MGLTYWESTVFIYALSSYGACMKFGEQERSTRVVQGDSQEQLAS